MGCSKTPASLPLLRLDRNHFISVDIASSDTAAAPCSRPIMARWLAALCAVASLQLAAAPGPEFDMEEFKKTYVRDGKPPPPALVRAQLARRASRVNQRRRNCRSVADRWLDSVAGLTHPRDSPEHDPAHAVPPPFPLCPTHFSRLLLASSDTLMCSPALLLC